MKKFILISLLSCAAFGQISCDDSSVTQSEEVFNTFSKGALNSLSLAGRNGLLGLLTGIIIAQKPLKFAGFCAALTGLWNIYYGLADMCNASAFNDADVAAAQLVKVQKKTMLRGWYGAGRTFGAFATFAALNAMPGA